MSTIESPGSFADFRASHPELSSAEAFKQLSEQVTAYRTSIAESLGVTPDTLHEEGFDRIVSLTVQNTGIEVEGDRVA